MTSRVVCTVGYTTALRRLEAADGCKIDESVNFTTDRDAYADKGHTNVTATNQAVLVGEWCAFVVLCIVEARAASLWPRAAMSASTLASFALISSSTSRSSVAQSQCRGLNALVVGAAAAVAALLGEPPNILVSGMVCRLSKEEKERRTLGLVVSAAITPQCQRLGADSLQWWVERGVPLARPFAPLRVSVE